jgi:hypothetical protein
VAAWEVEVWVEVVTEVASREEEEPEEEEWVEEALVVVGSGAEVQEVVEMESAALDMVEVVREEEGQVAVASVAVAREVVVVEVVVMAAVV